MADTTTTPPPPPPEQQQLYTSISFLKKRPDISHDEFYHHWEHVHGPLVKPWMEKWGFRSYTQCHALPALNASPVPVGPEVPGAANVLAAYDGAAVIEVDDLAVLPRAFEDEYYRTVIAEDEKRFLDKQAGVLRTRAVPKKVVKLL